MSYLVVSCRRTAPPTPRFDASGPCRSGFFFYNFHPRKRGPYISSHIKYICTYIREPRISLIFPLEFFEAIGAENAMVCNVWRGGAKKLQFFQSHSVWNISVILSNHNQTSSNVAKLQKTRYFSFSKFKIKMVYYYFIGKKKIFFFFNQTILNKTCIQFFQTGPIPLFI